MPPIAETSFLSPILAGRTADVEALRYWIEQARSGNGQVVLISGEAGIGKSRLVNEAKDIASQLGFTIFQGNCFEQDRALPFAPLIDLLRRLEIGFLGEIRFLSAAPQLLKFAPELASRFPDVQLALVAEPEQEKRNLFRAWLSLLVEGSDRSERSDPCRLIIIEDLHWCDDVSLEFVLQLARVARTQPIVLLLTYRSDEASTSLKQSLAQLDRERLAHELALKPLAPEHVEAMIRSIFNQMRPVSQEFVETIFKLTEGNPFFVEEVLKSLVASGDIFYANGRWDRKAINELRVPRTVQVAVAQRTEKLSDNARRALLIASVIGQRFDVALLQTLTMMDETQLISNLRELMAAQLVVEDTADEFAFRHALTREAAYLMLLKRERRKLHLAVGEALEQLHPSEEREGGSSSFDSRSGSFSANLSYHFYEAGVWDKALTYARRAGEQAQAVFAPREAIVHFTRAIEASQHIPVEARHGTSLHRSRGQAYETVGEFDLARADYEAALTQAAKAGNAGAEWENLFSLGFLWTSRDMQTAGEYLDRALDKARTLDQPAVLATSLNRVGNWRLNMEQSNTAVTLHQEALNIFVELNDDVGQALTNDLLGIANMLRGAYITSVKYHDTAIALFRKLNQPMSLSSTLGTAALRGGCYQSDVCAFPLASVDECWQLGSEAIRLAHQIEWRAGEANANAFLALAMGARGAYARAMNCAQDALDIALDIDHLVWGGVANIAAGKTHHDCFSFEMARVHLEQAVAAARRVGAAEFLRTAASFLASTLVAQGKLAEARMLLDDLPNRAPAETQTTSQQHAHAVRAELLLAESNPREALSLADALIAVAGHSQAGAVVPRLGLLRGESLAMLNRHAEAESALLAAAQATAEQTLRPLEWRIRVALGQLYHLQRKRDEAQAQFDLARTIVSDLMDELGDKAMRTSLWNGFESMLPGAPAMTPLRAAKQTFDGLTAREREIASFVAQGMTSRSIAERLVVSERTVEKHVENAMGKLGFTSRSQLAVWAAEKLKGEK